MAGYWNKGRSYGRRYYSKARSYGGRGRKKSKPVKFNAQTEFYMGALIGFTNQDEKIPADMKLIGATMPFGGKVAGKVKGVAQGMVFGNMVQHFINFRLPEGAGGKVDDTL